MGYNRKETPIIRDEEGLDDYYFMDDIDDFKDLCKLLNKLNNEKTRYEKKNKILTQKIKAEIFLAEYKIHEKQQETITLTNFIEILNEIIGE